ncbi:MAG TPA: hypothetical protein VMT73_10500, partial [Anaerolineales bacterium]|nr:hypothetical protein [Anaerolineales bacterium]
MRHIKLFVFISTITALAMAVVACGVSTPAAPSIDSLGTTVASTLTAYPSPQPSPTVAQPTALPTATNTSVPPTIPPPPPQPSLNLPAATRISFATGATESVTTGTIQPGQTLNFVVKALQSQPMIVSADSPNHDLNLAVFGANGAVLLSASQNTTNWQGLLPATQDYYFQITGGAAAENFTLNLIIVARIQFGVGQIQTTLQGTTVNGFAVSYVARAQAGQRMDVTINTDPNIAALTVWGFNDGQPYARAQNGVTNFSMTLPSTQDYI